MASTSLRPITVGAHPDTPQFTRRTMGFRPCISTKPRVAITMLPAP
ncbi:MULTISPECIES: hypothetical protein [Myxococcus]|nr:MULTISPECIES: hypothetical protein [Myxococcus]NTX08109.1 hypothetical protein [Myxococcus sp. CA040A]